MIDFGRSLFAGVARRWMGLRPVFFGPCTLRRTWGTRPGRKGFSAMTMKLRKMRSGAVFHSGDKVGVEGGARFA